MATPTLKRGDKVTVAGLAGVAVITAIYSTPGESDRRVTLQFLRRNGKPAAVRTDYERNCRRHEG